MTSEPKAHSPDAGPQGLHRHRQDSEPIHSDEPAGSGSARSGSVREALLHSAREELAASGPGRISLRAIARRAGVSHAAPKHHFGDRAGLLTALAIDGYRALAGALQRAGTRSDIDTAAASDAHSAAALSALGRAYVTSAMAAPEVFALMFRPELLHRDDPDLVQAQQEAFAPLSLLATTMSDSPSPDLALMAWSFAHGVAMLAREGALQATARIDPAETGALTTRLTDEFARRMLGYPPAVR